MKTKKAPDMLQEFVSTFATRGLLNQPLRVRYRDRKYRLFCSTTEFFVYRINEHFGVSPGFPGWPVCHVTRSQVVEDTEMGMFASTEPSAGEWLDCITTNNFDVI